ncbi:hypothetical protein DFH07DRAFT_870331 [Mycena maculata]|uniref:Uncharacterized protein n=1 Tax=Mycena maculata TaxID=230809 RepID=A0AAD7MZT5_9AGAR|nr:hypothetical protein DFH07DRAFT_870331 [Mycena maculata]
MVSSSRSMRSIFSQREPTYPSTSSPSFMFFVRPVGSVILMSTSRSNQPNRRRAGSMELGRLVAAMTTTLEHAFSPSMSVRS